MTSRGNISLIMYAFHLIFFQTHLNIVYRLLLNLSYAACVATCLVSILQVEISQAADGLPFVAF
jgi:fucose 4-O-acetylase-like acetyltransferase